MTERIWEKHYDFVIGGSDKPGEWFTHEIDVTGKVAVDAPCPNCEVRPLHLVEPGIVDCGQCDQRFRIQLTLEVDEGTMTTVGTFTPIEQETPE